MEGKNGSVRDGRQGTGATESQKHRKPKKTRHQKFHDSRIRREQFDGLHMVAEGASVRTVGPLASRRILRVGVRGSKRLTKQSTDRVAPYKIKPNLIIHWYRQIGVSTGQNFVVKCFLGAAYESSHVSV